MHDFHEKEMELFEPVKIAENKFNHFFKSKSSSGG
jgi:hypothetical protein